MSVRVLVVEDHHLTRVGTRRILEDIPGYSIAGETGDGREAVEMSLHLKPDLVLLDLGLRGMQGLEVLRAVKRSAPQVKVLVVTGIDAVHLAKEAMDASADGYVLKDASLEEFLSAVRQVLAGERFIQEVVSQKIILSEVGVKELGRRERQILKLVASGLMNKEIADHLYLSQRTVEAHVSHIIGKLGAANRTDAVRLARERGFLA